MSYPFEFGIEFVHKCIKTDRDLLRYNLDMYGRSHIFYQSTLSQFYNSFTSAKNIIEEPLFQKVYGWDLKELY